MVADDKNHRPLKGAHKDRITSGCLLPWSRIRVEGKQRNHCENQESRGVGVVRRPPRMQTLLQTSSWTSRGCVEEALLPTELMRTEWSTAAFSRWGLQFAKLE